MITHTRSLLSTSIMIALCLSRSATAGPLNPPPGPIEPTMITLDAIEPRIPLRDRAGNADCEHLITSPGHYIATADIIVPAGKHGILLALPPGTSGPISIDLNGFSIVGQPGSLDGVRRSGAVVLCDFDIVNGRIIGMGGNGVYLEHLNEAHACVSTLDCGGNGIEFRVIPVVSAMAINAKAPPPCGGHHSKRCGGHGVVAQDCGDVTIDMIVSDCGLNGLHVVNAQRCTLGFEVAGCGGHGVSVVGTPVVHGVAIRTKGTGADSNRVTQCGGNGVAISDCDDLRLDRVHVSDCVGSGVLLANCADMSVTNASILRTNGALVVSGGRNFVSSNVTIAEYSGDGAKISGTKNTSIKAGWNIKTNTGGLARGGGVPPAGARALALSGCDVVHIDGCDIDDCGGHGMELINCKFSRIERCRVLRAGGDGVRQRSTVGAGVVTEILDLVVQACGGDGVRLSETTTARCLDVHASSCGGDGIEAECDELHLERCLTHHNGGDGVNGKNIRKNITVHLHHSHNNQGYGLAKEGGTVNVSRSNIANNRLGGVRVEITDSLIMEEVVSTGNGFSGCDLIMPGPGSIKESAKLTRCRFMNNGHGTPVPYPGLLVAGASSLALHEVECSGNAGSGLVVADLDRDGSLDRVTCSTNGEYGIRFSTFTGVQSGRVRARGLLCDGNNFDGMLLESTTGGEVADSTFSGNGALGLRVHSFNHLIQRNTFMANAGGPVFAFLPGNTLAPIVDEITIVGNCNPSANHVR